MALERRWSQRRLAAAWAGLLLMAVLAAPAMAEEEPGAARESGPAFVVGVVNIDRIIDEYLAEELREPMEAATEELQAEFDRESEGLDQAARQQLLQEYQARLGAIREALIQERIPRIQGAIREVAAAREMDLVLDVVLVHYGGEDITDEVLARLGVVAMRP